MSIDDIFDKDHAHNALSILKKDSGIAMSFTNPGHYLLIDKTYVEYDFNISITSKFLIKMNLKNI